MKILKWVIYLLIFAPCVISSYLLYVHVTEAELNGRKTEIKQSISSLQNEKATLEARLQSLEELKTKELELQEKEKQLLKRESIVVKKETIVVEAEKRAAEADVRAEAADKRREDSLKSEELARQRADSEEKRAEAAIKKASDAEIRSENAEKSADQADERMREVVARKEKEEKRLSGIRMDIEDQINATTEQIHSLNEQMKLMVSQSNQLALAVSDLNRSKRNAEALRKDAVSRQEQAMKDLYQAQGSTSNAVIQMKTTQFEMKKLQARKDEALQACDTAEKKKNQTIREQMKAEQQVQTKQIQIKELDLVLEQKKAELQIILKNLKMLSPSKESLEKLTATTNNLSQQAVLLRTSIDALKKEKEELQGRVLSLRKNEKDLIGSLGTVVTNFNFQVKKAQKKLEKVEK